MAMKFNIVNTEQKSVDREVQVGLVSLNGGMVAVTLDGYRVIYFHKGGTITRGHVPSVLKDHLSKSTDGGVLIL